MIDPIDECGPSMWPHAELHTRLESGRRSCLKRKADSADWKTVGMAAVEAAEAAEAPEATSDAHILSNGLIGALYVARCRDAGVEPTPNGARRFQSEVVGLTEEWARNSLRAAEGLAHAVHLPNLRLGLRSAQVLSRGLLKPSALQLHSNAGLGDVGRHLVCAGVTLSLHRTGQNTWERSESGAHAHTGTQHGISDHTWTNLTTIHPFKPTTMLSLHLLPSPF